MSVTARLNRLRNVASDVTRTTVRVATPVVSATAAKVRARLRREPQPVRTPAPSPLAPEPTTEPVPVQTSGRSGPNPGSVARNIAPHPPQVRPAPPTRPAPPSAPGAKLPPRRRPAAEG